MAQQAAVLESKSGMMRMAEPNYLRAVKWKVEVTKSVVEFLQKKMSVILVFMDPLFVQNVFLKQILLIL